MVSMNLNCSFQFSTHCKLNINYH